MAKKINFIGVENNKYGQIPHTFQLSEGDSALSFAVYVIFHISENTGNVAFCTVIYYVSITFKYRDNIP